MKFGQDLHRHLVPEWSQYYLDYNLLKRLMKSDQLSCVYSQLDNAIPALESYLRQLFTSLKATETELCQLLGLGDRPTAIPDAAGVCPFELTLLLDGVLEVQQGLMKLQWFARVNTDAVDRIFSKLGRQCAAEESAPYSRTRKLWKEVKTAWEALLPTEIDRLDSLMTSIKGGLTTPGRTEGRSLYATRALTQVGCSPVLADSVCNALQKGEPDILAQRLLDMKAELGMEDSGFRALVCDLLRSPMPALVLKQLLDLLPEPHDFSLNSAALTWSIVSAGRSAKFADGSGTTGVYRRYRHSTEGLDLFDLVESRGGLAPTILAAGDLPLHCAASYGLLGICRKLMALWGGAAATEAAAEVMLTADNEGRTPLYLAVTGNHASTAAYLLEIMEPRETAVDEGGKEAHVDEDSNSNTVKYGEEGKESPAKEIMGDVLYIALRNENDGIVQCLLHHNADVSRRSACGETILQVAAQLGRADYVALILRAMSGKRVRLDLCDASQGRTALFAACAGGHADVVKLLLEAGMPHGTIDFLGWTAKECAACKGHLAVSDLFGDLVEQPEAHRSTVKYTGPPGRVPASARLQCREGERIIVAGLGTARKDRVVTQVNLSYCSSSHIPGAYDGLSFVLEVSARGTTAKPRRVRLPILDEQINDPFVFPFTESVEPQLVFKVIRLTGNSSGEILVGIGTTLLESSSHHFGAGRQSLVREQTVPILDKDTMGVAGTVTFTFLVVNPFPHLQTPQQAELTRGPTPLLVGHRGAGQNVKTHDYLQLGENTVESFLSAAKLGASFVEFDVQVTRDLHAVAFHDFSLSESGTDVPVHDLTLDQFLYASNIQSPHGDPLSVLGRTHSRTEVGRPRSRSLGRQFEAGAVQIRDRMKHTVDFKQKGFKPNTRGDFIQDTFATLKEILVELPEDIGCDIEIKYPRLHEAVDAGVAPVALELNAFVDAALSALHRHAGNRRIILSSFTPEVCIMLSLKQAAYPVFFITNAGKLPMADMEVRAASVQVAVHFARRWNLAGVVFACEPLLLCPRLVGYVKGKGLLCASYGTLNNEPEMVKRQSDAGVDIIVADRVGLIAKTLRDISVPNKAYSSLAG